MFKSLKRRHHMGSTLCVAFWAIFVGSAFGEERASAQPSEKKVCTQEEAIKAETEGTYVDTWPDLYRSFVRFGHCDDGAIAEGFSDAVAKLLAEHWDQFNTLAPLAKAHPKFEDFIIRHLDATISEQNSKVIAENARLRCPQSSHKLCARIESAAR
jgi:hypothetical protein